MSGLGAFTVALKNYQYLTDTAQQRSLAVSTRRGFSTIRSRENSSGRRTPPFFESQFFCWALSETATYSILTAAAYSHQSRWGHFLHVTDRNTQQVTSGLEAGVLYPASEGQAQGGTCFYSRLPGLLRAHCPSLEVA